jgi:uncharacterized protein YbaR (Trm112 family)/SAM-dependent methyltransferase
MRETDLQYLTCPACRSDLTIAEVAGKANGQLETGLLTCEACGARFPIVGGVPRFVPLENYASTFGLEWTVHARTQYDRYTGLTLSRDRFFNETGWERDLGGQTILEVGSGAGRFTDPAASTGAFVVSLDYSYAVDANYQMNGERENVLIVQGDVYSMPVRTDRFDKVFCFGMLQHTPRVRDAFLALPPHLRDGGQLVVDVYKKTITTTLLATKYWVRPLTRHMEPARLYRLTQRWVDLMWPFCSVIGTIPRIGRALNWRLLVADYRGLGLHGDVLREWAYLDTFDMLSPRYDEPQTSDTVRRWFRDAGLIDTEVRNGANGITGKGTKPARIGARRAG